MDVLNDGVVLEDELFEALKELEELAVPIENKNEQAEKLLVSDKLRPSNKEKRRIVAISNQIFSLGNAKMKKLIEAQERSQRLFGGKIQDALVFINENKKRMLKVVRPAKNENKIARLISFLAVVALAIALVASPAREILKKVSIKKIIGGFFIEKIGNKSLFAPSSTMTSKAISFQRDVAFYCERILKIFKDIFTFDGVDFSSHIGDAMMEVTTGLMADYGHVYSPDRILKIVNEEFERLAQSKLGGKDVIFPEDDPLRVEIRERLRMRGIENLVGGFLEDFKKGYANKMWEPAELKWMRDKERRIPELMANLKKIAGKSSRRAYDNHHRVVYGQTEKLSSKVVVTDEDFEVFEKDENGIYKILLDNNGSYILGEAPTNLFERSVWTPGDFIHESLKWTLQLASLSPKSNLSFVVNREREMDEINEHNREIYNNVEIIDNNTIINLVPAKDALREHIGAAILNSTGAFESSKELLFEMETMIRDEREKEKKRGEERVPSS